MELEGIRKGLPERSGTYSLHNVSNITNDHTYNTINSHIQQLSRAYDRKDSKKIGVPVYYQVGKRFIFKVKDHPFGTYVKFSYEITFFIS